MDVIESIWGYCPSDTNAVERKNLDSKESLPQQLQVAITNMYKYDKAACTKNIAAKQRVSVTYCDQSQKARKLEAARRNTRRQNAAGDLISQNGPPDHQCIGIGSRGAPGAGTPPCCRGAH